MQDIRSEVCESGYHTVQWGLRDDEGGIIAEMVVQVEFDKRMPGSGAGTRKWEADGTTLRKQTFKASQKGVDNIKQRGTRVDQKLLDTKHKKRNHGRQMAADMASGALAESACVAGMTMIRQSIQRHSDGIMIVRHLMEY